MLKQIFQLCEMNVSIKVNLDSCNPPRQEKMFKVLSSSLSLRISV